MNSPDKEALIEAMVDAGTCFLEENKARMNLKTLEEDKREFCAALLTVATPLIEKALLEEQRKWIIAETARFSDASLRHAWCNVRVATDRFAKERGLGLRKPKNTDEN